jgi:hypothetical protein
VLEQRLSTNNYGRLGIHAVVELGINVGKRLVLP